MTEMKIWNWPSLYILSERNELVYYNHWEIVVLTWVTLAVTGIYVSDMTKVTKIKQTTLLDLLRLFVLLPFAVKGSSAPCRRPVAQPPANTRVSERLEERLSAALDLHSDTSLAP